MKKCKIYPIEFYPFDGQPHFNGCYDGVIKEHKLYYLFYDYGDQPRDLSNHVLNEYSDYLGTITDLKDEESLQEKELFWPSHIDDPEQASFESGLLKFEVDGKWGFADIYTGEIKIDPVWDYADDFYRGMAQVTLDCRLQYEVIEDYEDKFYLVFKTIDGEQYHINIENKRINPQEFDYSGETSYPESQNMALTYDVTDEIDRPLENGLKKCHVCHTGVGQAVNAVIKKNTVYGVNMINGSLFLLKDVYYFELDCEGGLAQLEIDGKWGFVNIHTGKVVIEPTWDYAGPFYKGYAHVAMNLAEPLRVDIDRSLDSLRPEGGKHGYIDTKNELVIPLNYDAASDVPLHSGHYKVAKDNNKVLIKIKR